MMTSIRRACEGPCAEFSKVPAAAAAAVAACDAISASAHFRLENKSRVSGELQSRSKIYQYIYIFIHLRLYVQLYIVITQTTLKLYFAAVVIAIFDLHHGCRTIK